MPIERIVRCDHSPLTEVVLGVQFDPVEGFGHVHLGAFWKWLGEGWPHVQEAPALSEQVEVFGEEAAWKPGGLTLHFGSSPPSRMQAFNATRDRMVQLQNGRLHFNWLSKAGAPYPSYRTVRPEFDWAFARFAEFVQAEKLGEFRPNLWEITYVNHLPKGELWKEVRDWVRILPGLFTGVGLKGLGLDSAGGRWRFEIEPRLGRLHVECLHGRKDGGTLSEVLVWRMTARGAISGSVDLDRGLHLGHHAALEAFLGLTSQEARNSWGVHLENQ